MVVERAGAPPREALDWVAREACGEVVACRALPGGLASSVHTLCVVASGGARAELVLRRFTRRDWDEPDLAEREAVALRAVVPVAIPTPELVAFDPDGREAGRPAVLMTWLPGRPELTPSDPQQWLARLAALLPRLHGCAAAAAGLERVYAPYTALSGFAVPAWAEHPGAWKRALAALGGQLPAFEPVAVHRDFHPANVLFERGAVSGLVDWTNACRGPCGIDVAHCRLNLAALLGPDAAEAFGHAWSAEAGAEHETRWDLVACFDAPWSGYAPWAELGARAVSLRVQRERVEQHLCRLVAHC